MDILAKIISFIQSSEKLKIEARRVPKSNGSSESVAEHSWRLSLLVLAIHPHLSCNASLEKLLQLAIIHDLPELITGDEPYFKSPIGTHLHKEKEEREARAIQDIVSKYGIESVNLEALWEEYKEGKTYEAKIVKALDKVEAQIQLNQAPIETWVSEEFTDIHNRLDHFCDFEPFLKKLRIQVQEMSKKKVQAYQKILSHAAN